MNSLRLKRLFISLSLVIFILASCSIDNSGQVQMQTQETAVLIISNKNYTLPVQGGTIEVKIKGGVPFEYKIVEGSEWIEAVKSKSLSTQKLSFTIEANDSDNNRIGKILFSAKKNSLSEEVIVSQKNTISSAIDDICNKVTNTRLSLGKSIVFLHLSDTHSGASYMPLSTVKDHMDVVCSLASSANCGFIIHTGDAIHGYEANAESAEDSWDALLSGLASCTLPFLFAEGNYVHDMGYHGEITREQVQTYVKGLGKEMTNKAVYNEGDISSYYYVDYGNETNPDCRIIVLDSQDYGSNRLKYGFSEEQVAFIKNALDDASEKKLSVIFFAHMPPVAELFQDGYDYGMKTSGHGVLEAVDSYTMKGGKVLAYIYGHNHWDSYYFDSIHNIPYVCISNEFPSTYEIKSLPKWGKPKRYARTKKGLMQYAMDLYVISLETGKIHTFRFGAGADRIMNVIPIELSVGGSIPLTTEHNTQISWYTDDPSIANCNNGVVTGVSTGTTWISAQGESDNIEYFIIKCLDSSVPTSINNVNP